jgi:hypothetical protein
MGDIGPVDRLAVGSDLREAVVEDLAGSGGVVAVRPEILREGNRIPDERFFRVPEMIRVVVDTGVVRGDAGQERRARRTAEGGGAIRAPEVDPFLRQPVHVWRERAAHARADCGIGVDFGQETLGFLAQMTEERLEIIDGDEKDVRRLLGGVGGQTKCDCHHRQQDGLSCGDTHRDV